MKFRLAIALMLGMTSLVPALATAAESSPREKYILFCAGCHGFEGEGGGGGGGTPRISALAPRVGSFLQDAAGRRYLINVGGVSSAGMTDSETAIVLNYILQDFGRTSLPKGFVPYTTEEVAVLRKSPVTDPIALRKQIRARLQGRNLALPAYQWDE